MFNPAIAERYAEHGAKVTALSLTVGRTEQASQEIRDMRAEARGLPGDLRGQGRREHADQVHRPRVGPLGRIHPAFGRTTSFTTRMKNIHTAGFGGLPASELGKAVALNPARPSRKRGAGSDTSQLKSLE